MKILIISLVLIMAGCAAPIQKVSDFREDFNDRLIDRSVEQLCEDGTVGSIAEKFFTYDMAPLWFKLCNRPIPFRLEGFHD